MSQVKENQLYNDVERKRQKKVTRMAFLNSEEVALSQIRIREFLSDNANKDKTRPSAPSSPDGKKTKMALSVVKPNTTSTSPVEPQNPINYSDIACTSEMKKVKTTKEKTKEKNKRSV